MSLFSRLGWMIKWNCRREPGPAWWSLMGLASGEQVFCIRSFSLPCSKTAWREIKRGFFIKHILAGAAKLPFHMVNYYWGKENRCVSAGQARGQTSIQVRSLPPAHQSPAFWLVLGPLTTVTQGWECCGGGGVRKYFAYQRGTLGRHWNDSATHTIEGKGGKKKRTKKNQWVVWLKAWPI